MSSTSNKSNSSNDDKNPRKKSTPDGEGGPRKSGDAGGPRKSGDEGSPEAAKEVEQDVAPVPSVRRISKDPQAIPDATMDPQEVAPSPSVRRISKDPQAIPATATLQDISEIEQDAEEEISEEFETEDSGMELSEDKEEEIDEDEDEEEEEEEEEEQPRFICHEATYVPDNVFVLKKGKRASLGQEGDDEQQQQLEEEENFFPRATDRRRYASMKFEEIEYRPAMLNTFPKFVKKVSGLTHKEIVKYGCTRMSAEKVVKEPNKRSVNKGRKTFFHTPNESMEKKMQRLKIYRRAFGTLVIYFSAYSPLLFHIKKSHDDVLSYRIKQFKEANQEKMRIFNERISIENKIAGYRFPDHKRLKKAEQYLGVLVIRIRKQDEVIKYITDILTKMEKCLSDHYEKHRDLDDQIQLLDKELAERAQRFRPTRKSLMSEEEHANGDDLLEELEEEGLYNEDDEEMEDEFEEFNEDKRTVIILAYSVCMKDLEEAQKKLKLYQRKHEIEKMRKKLMGIEVEDSDNSDAGPEEEWEGEGWDPYEHLYKEWVGEYDEYNAHGGYPSMDETEENETDDEEKEKEGDVDDLAQALRMK